MLHYNSEVICSPVPNPKDDDTVLYPRNNGEKEKGTKKAKKLDLSMFVPFVKSAFKEMQENPAVEESINAVLDMLKKSIPADDPRTENLRELLALVEKFVNNGFFIKFTTVNAILKKVQSHRKKKPDKLGYNMSKMGYKSMKAIGQAIESYGELGASTTKTIKDLHSHAAEATNRWSNFIPYFGRAVEALNKVIYVSLEAIQLAYEFGIRHPGQSLVQKAKTYKKITKERKEQQQQLPVEEESFEDSRQETKHSGRQLPTTGAQQSTPGSYTKPNTQPGPGKSLTRSPQWKRP